MVSSKLVIIFIVFLAVTVDSYDHKNGGLTSYNPSALLLNIFKSNITQGRHRGYKFKFEDNPPGHAPEDHHLIDFINYDDNKALKFEEDLHLPENSEHHRPFKFEHDLTQELEHNEVNQYGLIFDENRPQRFSRGSQVVHQHPPLKFASDSHEELLPLKFQDPNREVLGIDIENINGIEGHNKKKRKKRRKHKLLPYQPSSGRPGYLRGAGAYEGYGYPGLQDVLFKRLRRPRQSLASDAFTAVTGALTSIALYDDYQCVPRLLCEAAGSKSLGTAGVLDSVAGIQPLLTLLSAYNGISSSPLYVFGRAVFLGMTSKGINAACRYAYPQCPTDPEQLIHYLNNHNGGFFRFFNAPPSHSLQQFYQHLGQNFNQNGQYPPDYYNQGLYRPDQQSQGGHGLFPQNLYGNQNYGQNYDYNNNGKIRFRDSKTIEDRIQNIPAQEANDHFFDVTYDNSNQNNIINTKFVFPHNFKQTDNSDNAINKNKIRESKTLRFPEDQNNVHTTQTNSNKKQTVHYPNTNNGYNNPNKIKYLSSNDFNNLKQQPYNNNNNYYQNDNNFSNNNIKHNPNNYITYNENLNPLHNNNIKQQPYNYNNNIKPNTNNNNNHHNHNDFNKENYYFDSKHGFYIKKENDETYINGNDRSKILYVVRGNGDPNNPEIVRLKTGESIF